jgi:hypothetical protein
MTSIFVVTAIAGIIPAIFTMWGERAVKSRAIAPILTVIGVAVLIIMCVLTVLQGHHWWYIIILAVEWLMAAQIAAFIVGHGRRY